MDEYDIAKKILGGERIAEDELEYLLDICKHKYLGENIEENSSIFDETTCICQPDGFPKNKYAAIKYYSSTDRDVGDICCAQIVRTCHIEHEEIVRKYKITKYVTDSGKEIARTEKEVVET